MSRTALARTYRPRRFGEMSTQEHVSETLRAAVARGRVAHAYLFSGPRGVGKTTAARVLAMALNCPKRGDDGEPCGDCESCTRIWAGRTSLDVVEIDAASNRGVDDARDLRERAMYAPTEEGRYKVYIIDEAHMLTREAWNALLKILEEPPPRVIFVFATTEPQKIQQSAAPILSRTQRFEFRRLGVPAIVERLEAVTAAEGVETDPQALLLLARRAEGGMRDALSLLDQALSFTEKSLTAADVQRILGLVADEVYLELFGVIAEGRVGDVFRFVQDVVEAGHDLSEFHRGLADAVRTLLVIRFDGADAAEVRDELRPAWAATADAFANGDLLRMLSQLAELDADGRFRKSGNPRVLLEAMLLRFAHFPRTVDVEALLRAAGGAPSPSDEAPRRESSAVPAPRSRESAQGNAARPAPPARESTSPGPRATAPEPWPEPDPEPDPDPDPEPESNTGSETGSETGSPAAAAALRELVAEGAIELPAGVGMLLRTARVVENPVGTVAIELQGGFGSDKLEEDVATRRRIQNALAERLGRTLSLEVRAAGSAGQERITPEKLRASQVDQLTSEEPALDRAVKEWDLEMLD